MDIKTESRVSCIDLFRAFGIILMIMGHLKFGGIFLKWIHAFHMPMFFFISGWFYREEHCLTKKLQRKARVLLLPYILVGAAELLCLLPLVPEYRGWRVVYYWLVKNTSVLPVDFASWRVSPVPGAMWFLTALFFCEMLYALLDRYLGFGAVLHVAAAFLAVAGMAARSVFSLDLPWALDAALVGMGFYHIARTWKKTRFLRLLELDLPKTLALGLFISGSILLSPEVNMRTGAYGIYPLFFVNALGGIAAGWNLSRHLEAFLLRKGLLQRVLPVFYSIGRNSIVYLCLNQIVILLVNRLMDLTGIWSPAAKLLAFFITMPILVLLERLILCTRLSILFGRTKRAVEKGR